MPRIVRNQLSAPQVRHAGPGRYVDGNGLMLYVKRSGARSWVQRLTIHGERVDLGLGSADPDSAEYVSLANARKVALDNRRTARDGRDPRRARVPSFDGAQQATCAESEPRWSESGRLGAEVAPDHARLRAAQDRSRPCGHHRGAPRQARARADRCGGSRRPDEPGGRPYLADARVGPHRGATTRRPIRSGRWSGRCAPARSSASTCARPATTRSPRCWRKPRHTRARRRRRDWRCTCWC